MCNAFSRGFSKHRRPTKHVSFFAHRGRLLLQKEEATSLNNGLNKK